MYNFSFRDLAAAYVDAVPIMSIAVVVVNQLKMKLRVSF
jgi:hypothetical protein